MNAGVEGFFFFFIVLHLYLLCELRGGCWDDFQGIVNQWQLTGNGWMKTVSPTVPCDEACLGLHPLNEYVYR